MITALSIIGAFFIIVGSLLLSSNENGFLIILDISIILIGVILFWRGLFGSAEPPITQEKEKSIMEELDNLAQSIPFVQDSKMIK